MMTREHGGDMDAAIARFGGKAEDWLDLSTGINPDPVPPARNPGRSLGGAATQGGYGEALRRCGGGL